jgi:hypothetical protein
MALTEAEELELLELEDEAAQKGDSGPSVPGVIGRGMAQGASFGFADEAMAGVEAPFSDKTYQELRDAKRQQLAEDRKAYPKTAIASEIGGAVIPSVAAELLSGGTSTPVVAGNAARIGSVARSVLNPTTIKGMMGAGAAYGLGKSEADLTEGEVLPAAMDTGKSALFAGALGKAIPAVGKYGGEILEGAGKKMGEGAEFLASKAVGLTKGLRKRFDLAPTDARAIGREALDSGVVTPFASAETMGLRQADLLRQTGDEIKAIIKNASDAGGVPNLEKAIADIEAKAARYGDSDVGKAVYNQYQAVLNDLRQMQRQAMPRTIPGKPTGLVDASGKELTHPPVEIPGQPPTISALQQEKGILGEAAYPAGVATEAKTGLQGAYTPVKEELESAVESTAGPEQAGVYKYLKDKFGKLETMGKGLTERLTSEEGNRFIRPTDFLIGGAFGLGGGVVPGVAAVATKRVVEKYGHQVGAVSMDAMSKILKSTPEALGAYAPIISKAIQRGGTSFATTNFLLQQRDPEYRKKMEELSNMKQSDEE